MFVPERPGRQPNFKAKETRRCSAGKSPRWDKRLEAEGSCVNDAWGTIMNREECEAVEKACSEDFEACD